jgi:hypothetical protein
MEVSYYLLNDTKNNGKVVRFSVKLRICDVLDAVSGKWLPFGENINDYLLPEGSKFGMYKRITENEVRKNVA